METKKRALGRGLEELFNNENLDLQSMETKIYESATNEEIVEIPLEELRPNPYQPRKVFDEEALQDLADSIKEHGVFQPIIIKKSIKGYEIIAGERRYRASKIAGLTKIPAIIRNFTDEQMMEIALLENLQRENLNAIEEAIAYKKMIQNLGITQEELAKKGIDIRVVDVHTIKPIDEEMIVKCAKETDKLISVEDHNIIGGLGSAISEVLVDKYPKKLIKLGIKDTFGMSGKAEELMKYYGIVAEDIIKKF